jgi:magnesium chelatase subunit D
VSEAGVLDVNVNDAELALALFLSEPATFGGIVLRGGGPVRDAMLDHAKALMAQHGPVVAIPANVDAERLLGGLDLAATLAIGSGVMRPGLLDSAAGGVVILPMAERVSPNVAAHLAQAIDGGDVAAIMLDDAMEAEEAPPTLLCERVAFYADIGGLRRFDAVDDCNAIGLRQVAALSDDQLATLATMAAALGVGSMRALLFAQRAATAHAALHGHRIVEDEDIAAATRLVLAPRATQMPQAADTAEQPQPERDDPGEQDGETSGIDPKELDDIVLEAAAAAIPPHVLDQIAGKAARLGKGQAGRAGQKQKSAVRGRPLSARAGVPGHGKRLALIDTLRAAAPWQTIRRRAARDGDQRPVHIRKSDLRVRAFEQRSESLTIFAVDASGSSALARLAEAKGAVELMLAQAYVKRSQVALIAFRHMGAEVLLPPTRSLTRARRALSALPGGGGTPLAAGLAAARQLAEAAAKRGQTPMIAVLTDGKANIILDGSANREAAMQEAQASAKGMAQLGINSVVIDISPRPRAEAAELAAALNGRYLPLPAAHSAEMVQAINDLAAP